MAASTISVRDGYNGEKYVHDEERHDTVSRIYLKKMLGGKCDIENDTVSRIYLKKMLVGKCDIENDTVSRIYLKKCLLESATSRLSSRSGKLKVENSWD